MAISLCIELYVGHLQVKVGGHAPPVQCGCERCDAGSTGSEYGGGSAEHHVPGQRTGATKV